MSGSGQIHRHANTPDALQLANTAIRLCNQTCLHITELWNAIYSCLCLPTAWHIYAGSLQN